MTKHYDISSIATDTHPGGADSQSEQLQLPGDPGPRKRDSKTDSVRTHTHTHTHTMQCHVTRLGCITLNTCRPQVPAGRKKNERAH